jgi:hypothetical protein
MRANRARVGCSGGFGTRRGHFRCFEFMHDLDLADGTGPRLADSRHTPTTWCPLGLSFTLATRSDAITAGISADHAEREESELE